MIDGCDTGVDSNRLQDAVDACEAAANNHGQFVSCVAKSARKLKKARAISGREKGQVNSCAAGSSIGN